MYRLHKLRHYDIRITLLHVLLNIVTICLVTRSDTARKSKLIADCSCTSISSGTTVHRQKVKLSDLVDAKNTDYLA